jgi:glycosyltransferase involved in cell wall biosynthesis
MISDDQAMLDRRVLQQAQALSDAGYDVTLLYGLGGSVEDECRKGSIVVRRHAIPPGKRYGWFRQKLASVVERVESLFQLGSFRWVRRDREVLKILARYRPVVVHVHNLPWLPHAVWLARRSGAKLVYDAHEIYDARASFSWLRRLRLRIRERLAMRHVAMFTTVNEFIATIFEKRYGRRPSVLLNAAPYEPSRDRSAARTKLRRLAGLSDAAKVVLFQGWLSPERNLETLIQAAALFPKDVHLLFIGYGPMEPKLRAMAESIAEGKVLFLGRREGDELRELTCGADVGVIPYIPIDDNHRYCSPNKFFEFVQARLPMLCHDLPFFREMTVRTSLVKTVAMDRAEAIAEGVRIVLEGTEVSPLEADLIARAFAWEGQRPLLLGGYDKLVHADTYEPSGG